MVVVLYLCCTVSKLGQDFGPVIWKDAHGIAGQVEFFQTWQRANVPDLLQLEIQRQTTHTCIRKLGCASYTIDAVK